ncbi:MAG: BrnT family toxin [Planctomycetota bacterium]
MAPVQYNFEWDPVKARSNRIKHGVSFEEAATVFCDSQMLVLYDDEHSDFEDRWITLGVSATGRLLAVCHTFRQQSEESATIRIFSSRKATKREGGQYEG